MIVSRVFAMARPCRPDAERLALIAAAGDAGTATERAARVARLVAAAALQDVDLSPADRIVTLLRMASGDPIDRLATDPEIDTAGLIVAERVRRLEARGGRRLPESEWQIEDREIARAVAGKLSARYRKLLAKTGLLPNQIGHAGFNEGANA